MQVPVGDAARLPNGTQTALNPLYDRKVENYFGLKWRRFPEQDQHTINFHTSDPREVHGTLSICVPSTVFFGALFVPDIAKNCNQNTDLFAVV